MKDPGFLKFFSSHHSCDTFNERKTMTALRWFLLFGLSAIASATEGTNREDLDFLARMKEEAGTVTLPSGLM
jgi:hypothetical protein